MQILAYYFLLLLYQDKLRRGSSFSEKINNLDFDYKLMKSCLLLITPCFLVCTVCNITYLQLGLSSLTQRCKQEAKFFIFGMIHATVDAKLYPCKFISLPQSLTFIMTLSDLYKILICTVKIKIDNVRSKINSLNPAQIYSLIGDCLQALLICTYRYLPYSLTVIMTLYKILICTVKVKSEGLHQFEIPNKIRFRV